MTKKEMIEKLKTTWTAFGGLTKEEQEFFTSDKVASNWGYVGATGKFIPSSNDSQILDNMLVRLSPDFKLPEPERWFYSNKGSRLICIRGSVHTEPHPSDNLNIKHDLIEVPPDDLPYVRARIERHKKGEIDLSEWEYRLAKMNEPYISKGGYLMRACHDHDTSLLFVRKAEAKVGKWKEFEVYKARSGYFHIRRFYVPSFEQDLTLSDAWHYAINRGMCPQFLFDGCTTWFNTPNVQQDYEASKPAELLKMRIWEEGK